MNYKIKTTYTTKPNDYRQPPKPSNDTQEYNPTQIAQYLLSKPPNYPSDHNAVLIHIEPTHQGTLDDTHDAFTTATPMLIYAPYTDIQIPETGIYEGKIRGEWNTPSINHISQKFTANNPQIATKRATEAIQIIVNQYIKRTGY